MKLKKDILQQLALIKGNISTKQYFNKLTLI